MRIETTPKESNPRESRETKRGRQEPMVHELMTKNVFSLFDDDNLVALDELMRWRRIRHVPVINDSELLVGLVTHRDFLRVAISILAEMDQGKLRDLYRDIPINGIMSRDVVSVLPDARLSVAARIMVTNKFGCVPVVEEDGRLIGILTEADFVKAFYEWNVSFH